jgi:hypothetical protein
MFRERWVLGGGLVLSIVAGAVACGSGGSPSGAEAGASSGGDSSGGDGSGGGDAAGGNDGVDCGCSRSGTCCEGACVDVSSDAANCGECGSTCSAKHGSAVCSAGLCVVESCDEGFVDCNGEPADGCEAKDEGTPSAPRLLSPAIGQNTGSALSDAARMPELRWTAAAGSAGTCGAVTYQVQVDDSCEVGKPCAFKSPELDAAGIEELHYRPEKPLEVATSAPVGTRYFWRVRACETETRCSNWTDARYLNVGRLNDDLNGDGYSDLFATSYDGESGYHLHLHPGPLTPEASATGSVIRPSLNLIGPLGVYGSARFLGDVNGDGFADAVRSNDNGAELLLGGEDFQKIVSIKIGGDFAGAHGVAGLGDWNGDGFADFAVSDSLMTETPPSVVHVYAGNAEAMWMPTNINAPAGTTVASFGTALEGGLDFDGDGYTDLFILDGNEGRVHFVAGGLKSAGKIKASLTTGTPCEYYLKPNLVRAGDLNGDGYGDLAARCDSRLLVFAGCRTPDLTPLWSHQFPEGARYLGHGIAGGVDLGNDGFADLLVHGDDPSGANLFMLAGSATLSDSAALVPFRGALSKDGKATAGNGLSAGDFDGDGRPDLLVQVKSLGELRLFTGGKATSGSCVATSDAETVGDWCRSAVTTIEGKYKTDTNPDYQIGSSFGASLAQ